MRILVVGLSRFSVPTGLCRYTDALCRALASVKGVEVAVAVGSWQEHYFRDLFKTHLHSHLIPIRTGPDFLSRNAWYTQERVDTSSDGLSARSRRPGTAFTRCSRVSIPDFARLHPCVRAVETARLGICLCPSGGEPRGLANSSPDHRRPATWVRRSAHVSPSSANRIGPAALKRHRPGSLQTISAPSASARTRPGVNGIRKLIHFRRSDTGSVFTCRRHPEAARRARSARLTGCRPLETILIIPI